MKKMTEKAVILARGVGSRMRAGNADVDLTSEQRAAAQKGEKGMMPIRKPFLAYVLHVLADAGYRRVCLVIGPEQRQIRDYFAQQRLDRLEISFAVQEKPLGTADAVAAASGFVGDDFFLTLNSDNYYPLEACTALRELGAPGVAGFDRDALIRLGNIPAERVAKFAILRESPEGWLERVIEKPTAEYIASLKSAVAVSMNCWMFSPEIFRACREIGLSARGEYELTDAVNFLCVNLKEKIRVLPFHAPVLDLSSQEDIPTVAARLGDLEVSL